MKKLKIVGMVVFSLVFVSLIIIAVPLAGVGGINTTNTQDDGSSDNANDQGFLGLKLPKPLNIIGVAEAKPVIELLKDPDEDFMECDKKYKDGLRAVGRWNEDVIEYDLGPYNSYKDDYIFMIKNLLLVSCQSCNVARDIMYVLHNQPWRIEYEEIYRDTCQK